MALNPIETLNVFDPPLQEELRKRSLSKNLIRTRAPFLRFTTAANMSDLSNERLDVPEPERLNIPNKNKFREYNGYEFFTLGIHGYDSVGYSVNDLYGTQSERGLVIGTTYKEGEQRLVRTFGGLEVREASKNYPPPGITSAKIERLRNGNVLRFTIETQCYTQEQLEMLDTVCYVPGMTCILEWGTQFSTPTGQQKIETKLNFKDIEGTKTHIKNAVTDSRTTFIKNWCEPNKFNYDWAVANIANIKTEVQNNIYKTTIVAYGRADNIMYISAYATANPLNNTILEREKNITKSVTEYFTLGGRFSRFLEDAVNTPAILADQYRTQIITFRDVLERRAISDSVPTAQQTGTINDVGLENVYYITFDFFVRYILNDLRYGLRGIVNSGISNSYKLDALLSPIMDGDDTITVGYNVHLRSTSFETMIIYNKRAIDNNAAQPRLKTDILTGIPERTNEERFRDGFRALFVNPTPPARPTADDARLKLENYQFGENVISGDSGTTSLRGVWLNSRAIQSAFLNARTIMEGLEILLRNINAATENYWDLKLFWDDDKQQFRILDDNNRTVGFNSNQGIYEFNKKLQSSDGDTIGPDVIDIRIATDYPKMVFSQLAISGINGGNLVSDPQRTNFNFIKRSSVRDIFTTDPSDVIEDSNIPTTAPSFPSLSSFSQNLFETRINNRLLITNDRLSLILQSGFTDGTINPKIQSLIQDVFSIPRFITVREAEIFENRLVELKTNNEISEQQLVAVTALFAERSRALVNKAKTAEIDAFTRSYDSWRNDPIRIRARALNNDDPIDKITTSVNTSRDGFLKYINDAVTLTEEQRRQVRDRSPSTSLPLTNVFAR
jgi:hypothetical protein